MIALRIAALMVALSASATSADIASRVSDSFRAWAADVGGRTCCLDALAQRRAARRFVVGKGPADRPVEIVSLSKAITAACVAELIHDGTWKRTTTSFEVLGYGKKGVTLSQLLTHSSGLAPDETQVLMPLWFGSSEDRSAFASGRALCRPKQEGAQGSYSYNNENYAILGEMITQQTTQPYAKYCADKVLKPAGVTTARASKDTGSFLPFGGWQISVQDYAAFQWHSYGPGGRIGLKAANWPQTQVNGLVRYGMVTFIRTVGNTPNYWHFGALCFPERLNIGSYAVIWQGEWQIAAAYDICPTWDQMGVLDRTLITAVFGR